MKLTHLALASVAWVAAAHAQQSVGERAENFFAEVGAKHADKTVVLAIDRRWPGDSLASLSLDSFRAGWRGDDVEGIDLESAERTFRLYQDFANDRKPRPHAWQRLTAPVPEFGSKAWEPVQRIGFGTDARINESEPNDSLASADPLGRNDTVVGCSGTSSDEDWYRMTLAAATAFSARVDPDPRNLAGCSRFHTDPTLELFDASGRSIAFANDSYGDFPQIDIVLPAGTYYWVVAASGSATGNYEFVPNASNPTVLGCGGSAGGTIGAAGDIAYFLLNAPANGNYRIDVVAGSVGSSLDAEVTLIDKDLTTEIATSSGGPMNANDARLTAGLVAGSHVLAVTGAGGSTGLFGITVTCTGPLPSLSCGGSAVNVNVGPEQVGLVGLQVSGPITKFDVAVTDTGLPYSTNAEILDTAGQVSVTANNLASPSGSGTGTVTSVGTGTSYLRLTAGSSSASVPLTWRDTVVAESWGRPTPTTGAYAGPTLLNATSGSFTFVNDHIGPGGILTIRKLREFFIDSGSWDCGTYIDQLYIDVQTTTGTQRFNPVAVRLDAPNASSFSTTATTGAMSTMVSNDGSYFGVNLVDASATTLDTVGIEFDFNLSSLGISGSQIQGISFFAEWYFAGNAASATTSSPPSSDDSSEERGIVRDDIELLRRSANTWDTIGDALLGTYTFQPPPPAPNPSVSATLTCTPVTLAGILSAEDAASGDIQAGTPAQAFGFQTLTGGSFAFETTPPPTVGEVWRDSTYAQSWGTTDPATYAGPVMESRGGGLPGGVVGPNGTMRIRLKKDACIDSGSWDDYWYFDVFELGLNTGGGRQAFYPNTMVAGGDVARFTGTASGVTFLPSNVTADDGTYATHEVNDYDPTIAGNATTYWVEFGFDVSSLLSQGQGAAIQMSDLLVELYMEGDGFGTINSTAPGNSSEEEYLVDLDLEVFNFGTSTWIDYSPTPIVNPLQFNVSANCAAAQPLDSFLWVIDAANGRVLGSDDDAGSLDFSRVETPLGSPSSGATVLVAVAASPSAATGADVGQYQLRVEAPAGFAGTAPFEVSVGSPFSIVARGNGGDAFTMLHSVNPHLPMGVPLPLNFVSGLLAIDVTGYVLSFPEAGIIPANGTYELGPLTVPNNSALVGTRFFSQGARLDLATLQLVLSNEDSIRVVP